MRWWPPLLHLALIAVLVPLAWLRIGSALDDAPVVQAGRVSARSDATASDIQSAGRPVDLEMLLARPLFAPDRRQASQVSENAPAESVTDRAADLRMVGYLNDGGNIRAILAFDSTGAQATVREGEVFEGFKVRSIQPGSVVVSDRGKEIAIRMFDR